MEGLIWIVPWLIGGFIVFIILIFIFIGSISWVIAARRTEHRLAKVGKTLGGTGETSDRAKFETAMAKVADVEPEESDKPA